MEQQSNFPPMRCSQHDQTIIQVCLRPNCTQRRFFCSVCITEQLQGHVTDHHPLSQYSDFAKYMEKGVQLTNQSSQDIQELVNNKNEKITAYKQHISQEKKKLRKELESLSTVFVKDQLDQLLLSLENTLDEQFSMVDKNFKRLLDCNKANFQEDCCIPSTHSIIDIINKSDPDTTQRSMHEFLTQRHEWEQASQDLRNLNNSTLEFHHKLLSDRFANLPTFVNANEIVERWQNGLTDLIGSIRVLKDNFSGLELPTQKDGIGLSIETAREMNLLQNKMIRDSTILKLKIGGTLDDEQIQQIAEKLSSIQNLIHLELTFEQGNYAENTINTILESIKPLQKLEKFSLSLKRKISESTAQTIGAIIAEQTNLNYLSIQAEFASLNDQHIVAICSNLQSLTQLTGLELNFSYNNMKSTGIMAIGSLLENLSSLLELSILLKGCNRHRNLINSQCGSVVFKAIEKMKELQTLKLELGQTDIDDLSLIHLKASIKQLKNLREVVLALPNNPKISEKYLGGLVRAVSKLPNVSTFVYNICGNSMTESTITQIKLALSKMRALENLVLMLRNVSVPQNTMETIQETILSEKEGKPLVSIEISA